MGDTFSPAARALLDAAKSDAPRAAARVQMWGAVSTATGVAAVAAKGGVAAGVVAATASSGKLLVVGALLGSVLTAGVGFAVARSVGADRPDGSRVVETASAAAPGVGGVSTVPNVPNVPNVPDAKRAGDTASVRPEHATAESVESAPGRAGTPAERRLAEAPPQTLTSTRAVRDPMEEQSKLILEARGALRRGEPDAALALLDSAHRLGSHKMEPEELAVRVRALRMLGRGTEADAAEATLRSKYADFGLAR
jgi:hypothetical protein